MARGFMNYNYNITDEQIISVIKEFREKLPLGRKDSCFKRCIAVYGIMDRDDFDFCWKNVK